MSGIWEPRDPKWDTEPPRDPALPARCYVVCSTPRNGSGMLCRGLADTGVAGLPAEYYNINQRVPLAERWGTGPDIKAYTNALRGRRSSPNGVFGTKLHADQFARLRAELAPDGAAPTDAPEGHVAAAAALRALLPDLRFVHLVRLDVERQAVSLWTALNRNVWSVRAGAAAPAGASAAAAVPYDFDALERCRRFLVDGDLSWDRFFRANAITPVQATYEELIGAFGATIARVLPALLGDDVARTAGPIPAAPDSVRQSDARSDALLSRFRAERAEQGDPLPTPAP